MSSAEVASFVIIGIDIILFAVGLGAGYFSGRSVERKWWQDEMVRRRHALFHWENGKWYWNEDEPPTPRDPAATKVKNFPYSGIASGNNAS